VLVAKILHIYLCWSRRSSTHLFRFASESCRMLTFLVLAPLLTSRCRSSVVGFEPSRLLTFLFAMGSSNTFEALCDKIAYNVPVLWYN
jgi:hypothetical protein